MPENYFLVRICQKIKPTGPDFWAPY